MSVDTLEPSAPATVKAYLKPIDSVGLAAFADKGRGEQSRVPRGIGSEFFEHEGVEEGLGDLGCDTHRGDEHEKT